MHCTLSQHSPALLYNVVDPHVKHTWNAILSMGAIRINVANQKVYKATNAISRFVFDLLGNKNVMLISNKIKFTSWHDNVHMFWHA